MINKLGLLHLCANLPNHQNVFCTAEVSSHQHLYSDLPVALPYSVSLRVEKLIGNEV